MMKALVLVGAALLCACGSGDNEDRNEPAQEPFVPPPPPDPITCDPAERSGTYRMSFTTLEGNCGEQAGALTRLDPDADLPDTCMRTLPDDWSENVCRLDRSITCEADSICAGCTMDTIAFTRQMTENGSLITGLMTINIYESTGELLCTGTYELRAQRQ